ncbi:MAG: aquaporin [Micromonosporaceae bacterium]|jgi:glycerol uptake facilitator protein
MKNSAVSSLGSEALGTLFFVFLGACAVATVSAVGLGAGLAWALALIVAVWVFSAGGGHLNPWVTLALALRGKVSWAAVPGHIIAQLVGGLVGALLAWWLFSSSLGDQGAGLAATHTAAEGSQLFGALAAEALATLVVVAVVYRLIGSGPLYGLGYGLAYGAGVLAIAGLTGASMNFARTLGAELSLTFAGGEGADWGNIWVYLVGPAVGVVLAWLLHPLYGGSETSTSES